MAAQEKNTEPGTKWPEGVKSNGAEKSEIWETPSGCKGQHILPFAFALSRSSSC